MRRGRLLLVIILLLGSLSSATAVAQPPGSELVEALASDAAGDDAYIALESIEAFPAGGGEAVLETGTAYEETVSYAVVDAGNNRLIDLTRPSPVAHSAGVFVAAPAQEGSGAEAAPAPEQAPPSSTPDESDTTEGDSPPSTASAETADVAPPDVCEIATDQTCTELLGPVIGDPPPIENVCDQLTAACDDAEQVIHDLETGDPCDPASTGQTCLEYIADVLGPFINDDLCDPDSTGQTCAQWLGDLLTHCSDGCDTECSDDATSLDPIQRFVDSTCEAVGDPLGPWSICDVQDTDAECPDPDDVIDLVWSIDNPLSDLECTASVSGPGISEGGGMARGRGTFSCDEFYVGYIEVRVCLHRASGGVWIKMGCRFKSMGGGTQAHIEQKIAEPCIKQQTARYRIRARGMAMDGLDPGNEDRDVAKATAKLYCPGPSSAADAASDALEFAESWLLTDD